VNDNQLPNRGQRPAHQPEAIPAGVVTTLVTVIHFSEEEVRSMTRAEATQRLAQGYTDQVEKPRPEGHRSTNALSQSAGHPARLPPAPGLIT
jgi:hypothetical protein